MKNAVIIPSESKDFNLSRKHWTYYGLSQYNTKNSWIFCNMLTIKGVINKHYQLQGDLTQSHFWAKNGWCDSHFNKAGQAIEAVKIM